MRLGDLRKEIEGLPDDTVLDGLMFVDYLPGYYDGRPIEYTKDRDVVYTNEFKLRFYMFEDNMWAWDSFKADKSYEENLMSYLSRYKRGKDIEDSRWDDFIREKTFAFKEEWENSILPYILKEKDSNGR